MIVKSIFDEMIPKILPIVMFISIVCITLRVFYLFKGGRRFIIYKEILSFIFVLYILCLYYLVIYQKGGYNGINFVPFKTLSRYALDSNEFMNYILGYAILFIPFGFFSSSYLSDRRGYQITLIILIISAVSEWIQYYVSKDFNIDDILLSILGGFIGYLLYIALNAIKGKLPKFMKSDTFLNLLIIIIIVISILFGCGINIFSYLK